MAATVKAATLTERVTELRDDSDVIAAEITTSTTTVGGFPMLHYFEVTYYVQAVDSIRANTVGIYTIDLDEPTEAAYWKYKQPSVLNPVPVPPVLVATEAEVVSFVTTQLGFAPVGSIVGLFEDYATIKYIHPIDSTNGEWRIYALWYDGGVPQYQLIAREPVAQ